MMYDKASIESLQRTENRVYRSILNLPTYTATEFLRGEVGSSTMRWRMVKGKLLYLIRKLKSDGNCILREIITKELREGTAKWVKQLGKDMETLGMNQNIEIYTKSQIIKIINEKDGEEWRAGMERKVTLRRYQDRKTEIKEETWFKNENKYATMMRARSDTLQLKWRSWGNDEEKLCPLCQLQTETLEHFLIDCDSLQNIRNKYLELQRPIILSGKETLIAQILLLVENTDEKNTQYLNLVEEMWKMRKSILQRMSEREEH